jgi:hypothetical protein
MRIAFPSLAAAVLFATAPLALAQTPAPSATPAATPKPAKHHRSAQSASPTPVSQAASIPAGEAAALPSGQTPGGPVMAVAPSPPARTAAKRASATPAPGGGPGMVWVNTKTHVYHQSSSRYYGKTKEGKYLSEEAAKAEGDKPAGGKD